MILGLPIEFDECIFFSPYQFRSNVRKQTEPTARLLDKEYQPVHIIWIFETARFITAEKRIYGTLKSIVTSELRFSSAAEEVRFNGLGFDETSFMYHMYSCRGIDKILFDDLHKECMEKKCDTGDFMHHK